MSASAPSSARSGTYPDQACTAACSATASLGCPTRRATSPSAPAIPAYPIGYFHIDIAEVHTEEGRLYLFVAIDRTSKFAFARLHERATRRIAADFLRALVAAVPYEGHTVLTDNGTQFTDTTPTNVDAEAA